MAEVIQCSEACTVTVQHEFTFPLLSLTPEEGAQIAVAILAVWAVAFGFRAIAQVLKTDGNSNHGE